MSKELRPQSDQVESQNSKTNNILKNRVSGHNGPLARVKASRVRSGLEWIFHFLAKTLAAIHWGIGMTTLPPDAGPPEERSFVLMWLGIIVAVIGCLAILVYFIS